MQNTIINQNSEVDKVTDYINGFVYEKSNGESLPSLMFYPFSEGRVLASGGNYEYEYWLKDHLGNTRVSFKDNGASTPQALVLQKDFYYPFGIRIPLTIPGDENKYLYNGKELFNEHGLNWYHYGARFYNPQIGQWHTMDPVDQYHSPYSYVGNNPIMLTDPDGRQAFPLLNNPYAQNYNLTSADRMQMLSDVGILLGGGLVVGVAIDVAIPLVLSTGIPFLATNGPKTINYLQNALQKGSNLFNKGLLKLESYNYRNITAGDVLDYTLGKLPGVPPQTISNLSLGQSNSLKVVFIAIATDAGIDAIKKIFTEGTGSAPIIANPNFDATSLQDNTYVHINYNNIKK